MSAQAVPTDGNFDRDQPLNQTRCRSLKRDRFFRRRASDRTIEACNCFCHLPSRVVKSMSLRNAGELARASSLTPEVILKSVLEIKGKLELLHDEDGTLVKGVWRIEGEEDWKGEWYVSRLRWVQRDGAWQPDGWDRQFCGFGSKWDVFWEGKMKFTWG